MRAINLIVVHCSATREGSTPSPEDLDLMHRRRGFKGKSGTNSARASTWRPVTRREFKSREARRATQLFINNQ